MEKYYIMNKDNEFWCNGKFWSSFEHSKLERTEGNIFKILLVILPMKILIPHDKVRLVQLKNKEVKNG